MDFQAVYKKGMNYKIIKVLLMAEGFYLFAGGLIGPIWAIYVAQIGGDILDASGAFGIFMLTAALTTYLIGRFEDHERHRTKFVVLGYFLGIIGFTGYLFVKNSTQLFIVQGILGLTVAVKDPAYDGLFSKFAKKHLTLAWGEWEAMDYVSAGIASIVGGLIANFYGFKSLLVCMLFASIAGFIFSLKLLFIKSAKRA